MIITPAFAQTAGQSAGGSMSSMAFILQMVLIGVVFWFFILRPQSKRAKEHKEKIAAVKKGDQVLTGGGLIGKVSKVIDDNFIEIELAQGFKVRALKSTLADVMEPGAIPAAND